MKLSKSILKAKSLDQRIIHDGVAMLRLLHDSFNTEETLTGGIEGLDWRGSLPTESYPAPRTIRFKSTSVIPEALQTSKPVGLLVHLGTKLAPKVGFAKKMAGQPQADKKEENKGGVSERPKFYGNAPLYFT